MAAKDVLSDLQQKAQDQESKDQALVDQLADLQKQMDSESAAAGQASYNQGFQDGVAQAGKDGEKLFDLDELNAKIADATKPMQDQMDALQAQVDGNQGQVDALNKQISDQKAASDSAAAAQSAKMSKVIADLKAKIAAQIRSFDISNETLANQLAAEANAPTPVIDDQGQPVVPAAPTQPVVAPTAPVQDPVLPTKEVPADPLAPATVIDAPSSTEQPGALPPAPADPAAPADPSQPAQPASPAPGDAGAPTADPGSNDPRVDQSQVSPAPDATVVTPANDGPSVTTTI